MLVPLSLIAGVIAPAAFVVGLMIGPGDASAGERVYRTTCIACHGADGKGTPQTIVGFASAIPDFTDCNFATRETTADWTAIIRDGGPVRSFSRNMPAFRNLLTQDEIRNVIAYIHTLCRQRAWPRGDLKLPLAQITEKAFPEDEVVLTARADARGAGRYENHLVYEKRFGSRDQLEIDAPFGLVRQPGFRAWTGGLGDISIANKHVFFSSVETGTILSGLGGVILPTAKPSSGIGSGTTAFEAFLLGGQTLPARSFFQFESGIEIPTDLSLAPRTVSWSGVLGTTVPFGPITRIWSPMVEGVGSRDLVSGAPVLWDIVPQFQLSLSAKQHIRTNLGASIPVTQTGQRHPRVLFYVLWDTYDGPLLWGWRGWCPGCQH